VLGRLLVFGGVFIVSLMACREFAVIAHRFLPRALANWLFFWPQLALAPLGFTSPADDQSRTFLVGGPNFAVAAAFWTIIGVAISYLLRRTAPFVIALVTTPVSFLVGWSALVILRFAFDVGVALDAP